MKVAVFSTKSYDRQFLIAANYDHEHELVFLEPRLSRETALLAKGFLAVCVFVNDQLDAHVLEVLAGHGTRLIALRCAGFNNVDLKAAAKLGMTIARVPAYSPYAVAEHTVGLMLTLNRKIHRAYNRVREGNFSLDGLLGFDVHDRTIGIVGTGKIGQIVATILHGFGCQILAYDVAPNPACEAVGAKYVDLVKLFADADIVTLHCPLTPETHYLVNQDSIAQMKRGVMLINTSRGALIHTEAVIQGLKSQKIGSLALDVYEQESDLFFEDLSDQVIQDDVFERLLTFPNVLITAHQAFFTKEALQNIAETTLSNITDYQQAKSCANQVNLAQAIAPMPG
ncbi:2-hydroxyacid dehydrogenase [Myxacorys almedinensis]|uniref:2-hydroxyacid dehydrogenase n=1 Tax=Myxacorys almedinensis A TaxID=2690445 RepID=A0A8J8CHE2_9CYAN|nr:2-hydroxyacid dehydrogenase [Myxacorys almedinensis]NDJ16549.1 2-hydroxyacid dehydrogenase [Myxacorys almedinensis A]